MSKDRVIDSLGRIDDDMIQKVESLRQKKKRPAWNKWAAMVACLCLVIGIAIPVIHHKGGFEGDPAKEIAALEFNGCFYEAVDIPEVLEKYGLPGEITADMAGEHVSYLKSDGGVGYEETSLETDIELYQYAPTPCRGVYVLRDGKKYMAALFCNFYQFDSNTNTELTELYRVYGIESADDIVSLTEMSSSNQEEIGTPVTDRAEINEFYNMTIALWSYGNDDFQKLMFGDYPDEETLQKAYIAYADDRRNLRIKTTDGLCFFISFHPNYDWIEGGGTMSYFQIDEQMHEWIDRNLG